METHFGVQVYRGVGLHVDFYFSNFTTGQLTVNETHTTHQCSGSFRVYRMAPTVGYNPRAYLGFFFTGDKDYHCFCRYFIQLDLERVGNTGGSVYLPKVKKLKIFIQMEKNWTFLGPYGVCNFPIPIF